MEIEEIRNMFAKAAGLKGCKLNYNQEEREAIDRFTRKFRLKALGSVRYRTVKSLDEMAALLHEMGIVSSLDEGRKLTPHIVDKSINYQTQLLENPREIWIRKMRNVKGETKYILKSESPNADYGNSEWLIH